MQGRWGDRLILFLLDLFFGAFLDLKFKQSDLTLSYKVYRKWILSSLSDGLV